MLFSARVEDSSGGLRRESCLNAPSALDPANTGREVRTEATAVGRLLGKAPHQLAFSSDNNKDN